MDDQKQKPTAKNSEKSLAHSNDYCPNCGYHECPHCGHPMTPEGWRRHPYPNWYPWWQYPVWVNTSTYTAASDNYTISFANLSDDNGDAGTFACVSKLH